MDQDRPEIRLSGLHAGVFEMRHYDERLDRFRSDSFDPRALWDRLNGDMELLRELVAIFTDEYPGLLETIGRAIHQQSLDEVRKYSHKLKGSALQFSGSGVVGLAAALEQMAQEKSLQGAEQIFSSLEHETAELARCLRAMAPEKGSLEE